MGGFRVNRRLCSSCIFGSNSPISPKRFEELKSAWGTEKRSQECHHASIRNKRVGCRGHYEAGRRGELYHPAVETCETSLHLPIEMSAEDKLQIAERLGLIIFVEVENDDI